LSDLRESGAIEQDADIVCFIHRPEYYIRGEQDANGNDIRGLAEFIVAKHRSGSVDDVKMRFRAKFARFENWTDNDYESHTVESKLNGDDNDILKNANGDFSGGNVNLSLSSDEGPLPF
jgi:replicative DNA helicase